MKRLGAPIVLAHGLLGFGRIAVRSVGLATYFRGVPKALEAAGNRVVLTEVPPRASVADRAERLRKEIRSRVGREPVHVIAHSMGGLDARLMITHLDMASQVLSLTTVGTPHRGTPVADRGLALGRRFGLVEVLRRSPIDHQAFLDLTTDACAKFNSETPDVPGVTYLSVAGVKPREQMLYALRFTHDVIAPLDGPNDGLVSARSAAWGDALDPWECDHVNLIGWSGPREALLGYWRDVRPLYGDVVDALAARGFA